MEMQYKLYRYRWVILFAVVPIILCTEMFWLALAPISSLVQEHYHIGSMEVSLFTSSYMIMYILFTLPASWVIDKFGYRPSLIIGALLTAVFGILRIFVADNYTAVLVTQFIIAAGQPFLLNISTKIPANWFPVTERSVAAGILTMAQYLGFVVPMILSPILAKSYTLSTLYIVYGIIACVCTLVALILTKERPALPPGPDAEKEDLSPASMIRLFKNINFLYVLIIAFISMGIFNTLLTLIESIVTPRGLSINEAGMIGSVFVVAGILGAVILPIISDKFRRRKPLFVFGITLLAPLYFGMTYVTDFLPLIILAGIAGFTIMGLAPILFQHGAEVAYPAQEGTSLGLILLMGQISGALFVFLFEAISQSTDSVALPMLIFVALTIIEIPLTIKMKESSLLDKIS